MEVTFTKAAGRRYFMTVVREHGATLAPRQGPGYHDHLPHDAVHFIVESEAGLLGGVFGRVARGESNIFLAADNALNRRLARRESRRPRHPHDPQDMERSEALASISLPLWELRAGHRRQLPSWVSGQMPGPLPSGLLERIMVRLDDFAGRWSELPVGGSVTLSWPLPVAPRYAKSVRPRRSMTRR